jgi:hypothetical protein
MAMRQVVPPTALFIGAPPRLVRVCPRESLVLLLEAGTMAASLLQPVAIEAAMAMGSASLSGRGHEALA